MIHFTYRDRPPHFVPLCSVCKQPIEDVRGANLAIHDPRFGDDPEAPSGDSGIFHKECDPDWYPWAPLDEALAALLRGAKK